MSKEKIKIDNFFNRLCEEGYEKFNELIKEFEIDYNSLIPFASWSSEKYMRICLKRNKSCELILICWMPGQSTEIHDHNGQSCWVYSAKGQISETIYHNSDSQGKKAVLNSINEGGISCMNNSKKLHKLHNDSNELAMSLHLYAQPIDSCNVYDEDLVLKKRMSLKYDENKSKKLINDLDQFSIIAKKLLQEEEINPLAVRIPSEDLNEEIDIQLNDKGTTDEYLYDLLWQVVKATPKTSSKLFFNQLFGGRKSKAILGDLLAVMLNNSMYTYKVAGVQVGIEKEIINNITNLIGYGEDAGGTFPTGGSMSNFIAMLMARDKYNEESKNDGVQKNMIIYTSEESHYSIEKNAAMIGTGRKQVRKIKSDKLGRMCVEDLELQINNDLELGNIPCMINATAGTTVLGAFDPINKIAKIKDKYNIWLHIDGAYKGAVIFSEKYKALIGDVSLSDSFSFNPHKMLGTPMTCSIIVVKDQKYLYDSLSNNAEYLYQTDGNDYNLGQTSFQCGRRNDALKFWTLWKSVGSLGLEKIVNHQFYLANVAREYIRNHEDYTLYSFENSISICFNYKEIPANELCTDLYESNKVMVGFGHFKDVEFIRLVTINSENTKEDILNFFKSLESFVRKQAMVS